MPSNERNDAPGAIALAVASISLSPSGALDTDTHLETDPAQVPPGHAGARTEPLCLMAALAYARRGWPVLPLHSPGAHGCSCGWTDCTSPGKHPRTQHGLNDASTDEATIRAWWTEWPNANVGVRTGANAGVIVLDIDGPDGASSVASQSPLPPTPCASTGRGHHYWFRHPGGVVSNTVRLLPGLDRRGDGGYVVAPPSRHASGATYRWEVAPDTVPLADAPAWVVAVAAPAAPIARSAAAPASVGEPIVEGTIVEGTRNVELYRRGRSLHARGATHETIAADLHAVNEAQCQEPLSASEVDGIAWNAANQPDRPDFHRRISRTQPMAVGTASNGSMSGYEALLNSDAEDQW